MKNKNLIVGLIQGYNFEQIRPFIVSLKNSGFKGDLHLFCSNIDEPTCNKLRKFSIKLIPFKETYPFFTDLTLIHPNDFFFNQLKTKKMSFWWRRWIMYYFYLSNLRKNYSKILLTDVRDVIFQLDPFDFKSDEDLCFFLEDIRMKINICEINTQWIRDLFGEEILAKLGDNYISCAGTIIGSPPKLQNYLKKFMEIIFKIDITKSSPQAVHNYLIYMNLIDDFQLFENENGPVLSMHHKISDTIRLNKKGLIINNNDKVVNVIHQYDRHPELIKKFLEEYIIKSPLLWRISGKLLLNWKNIAYIVGKKILKAQIIKKLQDFKNNAWTILKKRLQKFLLFF